MEVRDIFVQHNFAVAFSNIFDMKHFFKYDSIYDSILTNEMQEKARFAINCPKYI